MTADSLLEKRIEFLNKKMLPAVIIGRDGESLTELLSEARLELAQLRLKHGAVLFRGFGLTSASDFRAVAALAFEDVLRSYVGGVSPRGEVMAGVYESTRMAAPIRIPQHNEMSYLPEPPRALAFFCEVEPKHGGETPLADSREIYKLVPREIREVFERKGISYHRYLYGPKWNLHHLTRNRLVKLHTSWMAAFSTQDPAVVEKRCAETGGTVTWDREEGAKINNVLPAVRTHPETGEMLWFNQVSSFLSSPRATGFWRWMLYNLAYPNPFRRPFHATLGDGQAVTLEQLNGVNDAVERATAHFPWRQGDLLLVDNFLVTHGRMPFRGERRILVAIH